VVWKWKVDEYRHKIGCSTCKSSPRAAFDERLTRSTTKFGGVWHFHVLKHSIATHLLDAGADLRFVQDWVGHASIKNTVIYAQLTSRRRDEEAHRVFASPYVV
jgi:site-specific recombinase XerD